MSLEAMESTVRIFGTQEGTRHEEHWRVEEQKITFCINQECVTNERNKAHTALGWLLIKQ